MLVERSFCVAYSCFLIKFGWLIWSFSKWNELHELYLGRPIFFFIYFGISSDICGYACGVANDGILFALYECWNRRSFLYTKKTSVGSCIHVHRKNMWPNQMWSLVLTARFKSFTSHNYIIHKMLRKLIWH